MDQKRQVMDSESKIQKEKITTMSQIVELFKNNKIDEIVIASEKTKIPGTKETVQGLRPDLDAYMALYLLNNYNNKPLEEIYSETARTTVTKKNGEEINNGDKELLDQIKTSGEAEKEEPSSKLIVYVDTGGEWLKIKKDGVVSTVYIDHHGHGTKQATSGTKMMLEIMRKAGMLKELPPWMSKLINFTNDIDNLSYINKKDRNRKRTFNESYFRNEWPNSLYALAEKQIPFETLIELFKTKLIKDPTKPFTEKELAGELGSFMVGENSIRDLCKQKMAEVSGCLENGISKAIKHNKDIKLETPELGKIIYNNFFREKGRANTIPKHLAMKATIAKGYDSFVSWNKQDNEFFINAIDSKSLVDIARRLNEKFPGCANEIRGKFIFGKIDNMTEGEFLEIIGLNTLNNKEDKKDEKKEETIWTKEDEEALNRSQEIIRIENEKVEKIKQRLAEIDARLLELDNLEKLNKELIQSIEKENENPTTSTEEGTLNAPEPKSDIDEEIEPDSIPIQEPEEIIDENVSAGNKEGIENKPEETAIEGKIEPDSIPILEVEEVVENTVNTEKGDSIIPAPEEKSEIVMDGGQEVTVLKEPLEIKIEEVIDGNVTNEEKQKLQEEFPNQNIENVIENEVVTQMNDKTIVSAEERNKDTKIKRIGRKVKNNFLAILISASSFHSPGIFHSSEHSEILAYNNIKIENLKDWENIKLHEDEINKLENISIITKAHENSNDKYLIIDKKNGKAHRYQGDSLIKSYNVCLGDSIGDEQTVLKSTYGKIIKDLGENEDGNREYIQEEATLEEATYVQNGERYIKDGYKVFTEWGGGNMKTGAGIYTVSNKGPFLEHFGIFLKNERGVQVSTSLHANSHLKTYAPDFRFTNGCIGSSEEDNAELYKLVSLGEKIYVLPDNEHNKYQIIDGELRFLSNQQNVNRTIRPYESKPILIKAENPTETAKVLLMTISENKQKLMSLYPTVSNDVYNELAKIAYGICGQESTFGTYGGPRGQFGRVKDVGASVAGFSPSVGPCQVRLENVDQKIRKAFNIRTNDDLFDTKINAIAAMSILLDNYLYVSYNEKESEYKKLVILKYNAALEAKRVTKGNKQLDQLGPKTRSYIKKVLNYSKLAKVYTVDDNDNYYNPNWNYGQPNETAMNNINN